RDREHAGQSVRQRPHRNGGDVDAVEPPRLHAERSCGERHEGADRRHEAREENRERSPAMEEGLALLDQARMVLEWPGIENLALAAMADPERRAVADQGAGSCGGDDACELQ